MAVASVSATPALAFDRRGIGLLSVAHVVNDMNQSVLPAIIPWLVTHRGLSLAAAATLVLAMNLSSSAVQPFFGHLSDSRSLAWVIPVALILATFGTAALGFAPNMPLMLLAALVSGIGVALFHPESTRFANYFGGERRSTAMGAFTTGGYLGFAVGPIVITPLVLAFGLHGTGFLAIPGVVLAVLVWREMQRFADARAHAHRVHRERPGRDDWRAFSMLTVVVALRSTTFFAAVTFTSLFTIAVAHVSNTLGSAALAALLVGGAVATMLGGRFGDRIDRRRIVVCSLALTVLAGTGLALCGAFAPYYPLILTLAAAFGLSIGLSASVVVVIGQEYLPKRIGIAAGVTLGLSVTIGGIAAPLFGMLGDRHGLVPVIAALTAFAFASCIAAFFLPKPAGLASA